MSISQIPERWMRIQLARVFRKYVSPTTPVEMLKHKNKAAFICEHFGAEFRSIIEVQRRFGDRPIPDEALCAILWEYKDRGKKGYDLTERMFIILRGQFPELRLSGPERAGKDVLLGACCEIAGVGVMNGWEKCRMRREAASCGSLHPFRSPFPGLFHAADRVPV